MKNDNVSHLLDHRRETELWRHIDDCDHEDFACAMLLKLRGHVELATRVMDSFATDDDRLLARAKGLALLRSPRTMPGLVSVVLEADRSERSLEILAVALPAMVRIGGSDAVDALVDLLTDHHRESTTKAVSQALICLGKSAVARLVEHLSNDHSELTKLEVGWALAMMGQPRRALALLRDHADIVVERLLALGELGFRILCDAHPSHFGVDGWHEAIERISSEAYRAILQPLATKSALARCALAKMDERKRCLA